MRCRKCNETFEWLLVAAVMKDAGGRVSPDPMICAADNQEHNFLTEEKEQWDINDCV